MEDSYGAMPNPDNGRLALARTTPHQLDGRTRPRSGEVLAPRSEGGPARPAAPTGARHHTSTAYPTGTADSARAAGPPDPIRPSRPAITLGRGAWWPGSHRRTRPRRSAARIRLWRSATWAM